MDTQDQSSPITLQISIQPRKHRNDPSKDSNANRNDPQLIKLEVEYPVVPLQYTPEQWSPQNPMGLRQYNPDFLRNLRYTQQSMQKPPNLPVFFFIHDEVQTGYAVVEEENSLTELFTRLTGEDTTDDLEEPSETQQPTKFKWKKVQKEGLQRSGHAIVSSNNDVYILGGRGSNSRTTEIQKFNQDAGTWDLLLNEQDAEEVPFQRWELSVVPYEHLLFLWGGGNYTKNCNTLYCYDTNTSNWFMPKINSSQPMAGWGHSACIINQAIYIFSGTNRLSRVQGLRIFDLNTMAWHNSGSSVSGPRFSHTNKPVPIGDNNAELNGTPPNPRWSHTAVGIGDIMYVWGGRDYSGADCTPELYAFDTTNSQWSIVETTGDIPQPRRGHTAVAYKQMMYIFGGYSVEDDRNLDDIHRFDPVRQNWEHIKVEGEVPSPRDQHVCTVIGNRLLIHGGQSYDADEDDFYVCKDTWMLQML